MPATGKMAFSPIHKQIARAIHGAIAIPQPATRYSLAPISGCIFQRHAHGAPMRGIRHHRARRRPPLSTEKMPASNRHDPLAVFRIDFQCYSDQDIDLEWKLDMRIKTSLLLGLALLSLTACSTTPSADEAPPIEEIDQIIADAVEVSASSNRAIAEVEVAVAAPTRPGPLAQVPPTVVLPPEAIQPITVDWQGPLEPLIQDLAARAGYSFRMTGRAPANARMISVVANEEPLFGIIRRVGAMVHDHADIAFNPSTRTIELRYGG